MKTRGALILALAVLVGCSLEPPDGSTPIDPDPDPGTAPTVSAPNILIAVNLDGTIKLLNAQDPGAADTIVNDASTVAPEGRVRIDPTASYLLYNSVEANALVLYRIAEGTRVVEFVSGGMTDEFEFVDSSNVIYSYDGVIYSYNIPSATKTNIVPQASFGCDHFPVLNNDHSLFVFKNQPQNAGGSLSVVTKTYNTVDPTAESPVTLFWTFPPADSPVELHDSLYFCWLVDDTSIPAQHLALKPGPGLQRTLGTYDFTSGIPRTYVLKDNDGAAVSYSALVVAANRSTLLFYGGGAVYTLDLATTDFDAESLTLETLYQSEIHDTIFGAFTPDSQYIVVTTDHWVGMYATDTHQRVALDSTAIAASDADALIAAIHGIDAIEAP